MKECPKCGYDNSHRITNTCESCGYTVIAGYSDKDFKCVDCGKEVNDIQGHIERIHSKGKKK